MQTVPPPPHHSAIQPEDTFPQPMPMEQSGVSSEAIEKAGDQAEGCTEDDQLNEIVRKFKELELKFEESKKVAHPNPVRDLKTVTHTRLGRAPFMRKYTITNVKYKNLAILHDSNTGSDLKAGYTNLPGDTVSPTCMLSLHVR
jgi:hypothetical protein